jgi:myo-inositol-1-phosphate synthase
MTAKKVRVAVVGVGNCASSLVQGLEYYKGIDEVTPTIGLANPQLAGYSIDDISIVTAFDVDDKKVGKDLSEAVHTKSNDTITFAEVPPQGVEVLRGPTLDGWGSHYERVATQSSARPVDVAATLRKHGVQVVVCYLPVGSESAARAYAESSIAAGAGFVNCIPVFIASDPIWAARFSDANIPIIGDDIKAQLGATITHRTLVRLLEERGGVLDATYQLNVGGNMDFLNMTEPDRVLNKKKSKVTSVASQLLHEVAPEQLHAEPSGHVPWLHDRKIAYIHLEGRLFGGTPININLRLDCWDSPNSAGIVIDAIRSVKAALDRGEGGPLDGPCSYLMKSPPHQLSDAEARVAFHHFVDDHRRA